MDKDVHGLLHRAAAKPSRPLKLSNLKAKAQRRNASVAALTVAIVGVLGLTVTTWALRNDAGSPSAARPNPAGRVSLAPAPPLPVAWRSLTGPQTTVLTARRGQPVRVGIHLGDGRGGNYVVTQARIDVLPVGVHPYESTSGTKRPDPGTLSTGSNRTANRFDLGTKPHVRRLALKDLPSTTNRDVTILFDGTDSRGRPLPAGRYEVGLVLSTKLTKAQGTLPAGSTNGLSGLLVTINYLG